MAQYDPDGAEWIRKQEASGLKIVRIFDHRPDDVLLEPECFEDFGPSDPIVSRWTEVVGSDGFGPGSRTVGGRFISSTAGWPHPPDPAEFYRAVRAPSPTDRELAILTCWLNESTGSERFRAWMEQAYTMRQLVLAVHRIEHFDPELFGWLNDHALPWGCVPEAHLISESGSEIEPG